MRAAGCEPTLPTAPAQTWEATQGSYPQQATGPAGAALLLAPVPDQKVPSPPRASSAFLGSQSPPLSCWSWLLSLCPAPPAADRSHAGETEPLLGWCTGRDIRNGGGKESVARGAPGAQTPQGRGAEVLVKRFLTIVKLKIPGPGQALRFRPSKVIGSLLGDLRSLLLSCGTCATMWMSGKQKWPPLLPHPRPAARPARAFLNPEFRVQHLLDVRADLTLGEFPQRENMCLDGSRPEESGETESQRGG